MAAIKICNLLVISTDRLFESLPPRHLTHLECASYETFGNLRPYYVQLARAGGLSGPCQCAS